MRMSCTLMAAGMLLIPLQAAAQSGGAAGTGPGGSAPTTGAPTSPTGSPNVAIPGPPGTNALGTAQSSGRGVTTGSASGNASVDDRIRAEDSAIDKKLKSICRGC